MGTWRCALSSGDSARAYYPRVLAALTRRFGAAHLDQVEDAVQTALLRALEQRPPPVDVEAWVLRVAGNHLVDGLRRSGRLEPLAAEYFGAADVEPAGVDDELALMFLCCHPSLSRAAQLAVTLKIACGLTPRQIAAAFLTTESTIAQRVVRAKQRLREAAAAIELPDSEHLRERLEAILEVVYLMFAEGYTPTGDDDSAVHEELCREALRLCRLITEEPRTDIPAADALRALVCFQTARLPARFADDGSLLLLSEQDRSAWDRALLDEGFCALDRAGRGDTLSRFHLEAGIAACHAAAISFQQTDWPHILFLYDMLRERFASAVVDVNRAVAVAMVHGAAAGLEELDSIPERDLINRYPYALATYAELYTALGRLDEARQYLRRALEHQPVRAQRRLLQRKLDALLAH